ncbi:MAG: hypothetical protein PVF45_12815 [Anaerolineae bacterium]
MIRITLSLLGAAVFYVAWMAAFLFSKPDSSVLRAVLWLLAPVLTAAGFALGIVVADIEPEEYNHL